MLRSVLRPGWIALGVVVIAFAVACFTLLAPWQLGKNSSTHQRNELIRSAAETDPVPLAQLAPTAAFDPSKEWREVTLRGRYLPQDQALVRLRNVDEQPAIEVVTPFAVAGTDRVIAVNRGYVRPREGAAPPIPAVPPGDVTITGRIRAPEGTSAGRGAHAEEGMLAVYSIDPAEIGRATATPMDRFYIQLSPAQPGSLGEIPLPQLDSGPYLSYGLQWLAFGIMAPLGAAYFLFSEIRHRRRAGAGSVTTEPDGDTLLRGTAPGGDAAPGADAAEPTATPDTRAERKRRVRSDLRAAGVVSGSRQVGQVGTGPDATATSDGVRDKLSRRYGG